MKRLIAMGAVLFGVGLLAPCQEMVDAGLRSVTRTRHRSVERRETSDVCDHKPATCSGRRERREKHADKATCSARCN